MSQRLGCQNIDGCNIEVSIYIEWLHKNWTIYTFKILRGVKYCNFTHIYKNVMMHIQFIICYNWYASKHSSINISILFYPAPGHWTERHPIHYVSLFSWFSVNLRCFLFPYLFAESSCFLLVEATLGPYSLPPIASSFADDLLVVSHVAYSADCGDTCGKDGHLVFRGEAYHNHLPALTYDLGLRPGRHYRRGPGVRVQLQAVNDRPYS